MVILGLFTAVRDLAHIPSFSLVTLEQLNYSLLSATHTNLSQVLKKICPKKRISIHVCMLCISIRKEFSIFIRRQDQKLITSFSNNG